MSKLLKGITRRESRTENGAVTNSTTLNPVLDLFSLAGASRQLTEAQIISKFSLAYNTNKELTLRLLFWAGDVREGAGERRFFRVGLGWLWNNHPEIALNNIENIPFFSRVDSLFSIKNPKVYEYLYTKLKAKDGLVGKWMPRKKQYDNFGDGFRRHFKMSLKYYRQLIVQATEVVENKMCDNEWAGINYSHVPSCAFKNYRGAFKKHDESRFNKFIEKANNGEVKINAKSIFPHDIVCEFMRNKYSSNRKAIDAQWKNLPDLLKGNIENILPVCDTSASMTTEVSGKVRAIDVCLALGIYVSERMGGAFKDNFLTFSRNPKLQTLKGNVCDRIEQVNTGEVANTDLKRVFELILDTAVRDNLSQEDLPSKVLILSDMEFDRACDNNSTTNFEYIDRRFTSAGYKRPQIVFWNLASRSTSNYPVQIGTAGTALVSGFSPNVLKCVLGGLETPEQTMLKTLNDERYSIINF